MFTRLFFLSTAAVTLAGALLMGGALAWKTADSARGAAIVGSNGLEISYHAHCPQPLPLPADVVLPTDADSADIDAQSVACLTLIGPNGSRSLVGKGVATNTGDFNLRVTGGSLNVTHVINRNEAADIVRLCTRDDFKGGVEITGDPNLPPGETGAEFAAFLALAQSAPASCQGDIVLYRVTVEAENPLTPATADTATPAVR